MASVKFVSFSCSLSGIIDYITNREKTVDRLVTGVNCVAQSALHEFETVKKQFHKTDGGSYYHIVQAFSPDDKLDFDTAHEIGLKFAQQFGGYQCLVATHMNTRHIHNHIVMNSVNYETGKKFHQTARELQRVKEYSNELCMQYGLSITETKADPFHIPAWKKKLQKDIRSAMESTRTKREFIEHMEKRGYKVDWQDDTKYITYTTPNDLKCRDKKLFDQTLLRENMEHYFAMGGCGYLQGRREATSYGEQHPTVDDAVSGLVAVFDALAISDNDRFHMETVHHSEEEIELILRRSGKIDYTVQYAVMDDESMEEEYQQYHGFGMTMMM